MQCEHFLLTYKHLAIVRAALTFWDEETAAANQTVYQQYLHSSDRGNRFTALEVATARRFFNEVELKYALCENETGLFVSELPIEPHMELSSQSDVQHLVCVLRSKAQLNSFY